MPNTTISLLMPNYNHAVYLETSIRAMLAQTRPADEIIIIDDKSTDDSREVIGRLTAGCGAVRVFHNDVQLGVLRNLNLALTKATGDFVAFPSADDVVHPSFLAETEALLLRNPVAAFCSARVDIADHDGVVSGQRPVLMPAASSRYVPPAEFHRCLAGGDHFFLGAVTLYRRQALLDLGSFDLALGAASDGVMQLRLAGRHGFCFVPRVLGVWRIHGTNFSTTTASNPLAIDAVVAQGAAAFAREPAGVLPAGYAALYERRLRFSAARQLVLHYDGSADALQRLTGIAKIGAAEAHLIGRILQARRLGTLAAMVWLTVRFRPFSLRWLAIEPFRRRWAQVFAAAAG